MTVPRRHLEYSFQKRLWQQLNDRYHEYGAFWQNTTFSQGNHHDPFPGRGAGDIIGCLCGKWVELELKTWTGKWRELQIVRAGLVRKCGGIYLVVREELTDLVLLKLDGIVVDHESGPSP